MEYKISKGWRIFIYLVCPFFFALGIFLISELVFTTEKIQLWASFSLMLLGLLGIWFSIYTPIRIYREKLTIQEDQFVYQLAFKVKEMRFEEIKGFRIDEAYFRIIPNSEDLKPLNISRYIERKDNFISFLYVKFEDLTAQDRAKEAAEILNQKDFGDDNFKRDDRFALAKRTTSWLNGVSIVVAGLALFYPHPYDLVMLLNMLLPFIGVAVVIHFKGLIKIDQKKNSIYPSLYGLFLIPGCVIGLRASLDLGFIDSTLIWIYSFPLTILIVTLLIVKTTELGFDNKAQIISTILFSLFIYVYSASTISMANTIFDQSERTTFNAEIAGKNLSGKYKNRRNLKLTPGWHPSVEREINSLISSNLYNRVQVTDSVSVDVYVGAFGIEWFEIRGISSIPVKRENTTTFKPDSLEFIDPLKDL